MPEDLINNPTLGGITSLGEDPFGLQGYTYKTSLLSKKNARNAAKAEAAYNAKVNYAYWVANNLYNSPSAQMARFEDAGLNPNLIYGKENNVVAGSTPQAHGTVPTGGAQSGFELGLQGLSGLVGMISSINGLKLQNSQNQKAQAEADVATMRAQNYFLDSLTKEKDWQVLDMLSKLPAGFDKWTDSEWSDWLDSYASNWDVISSRGKYGTYSASGRVDPTTLLGLKAIGGALKLGNEGIYSEDLFKSLLNLRNAQTSNVKESREYTESRREYQDYYNKYILPLLTTIKEADASFAGMTKGSDVLSKLANILGHIF